MKIQNLSRAVGLPLVIVLISKYNDAYEKPLTLSVLFLGEACLDIQQPAGSPLLTV